MTDNEFKENLLKIATQILTTQEEQIILHPYNNWRRFHGLNPVSRKIIKKIQRKTYGENRKNIYDLIEQEIEQRLCESFEALDKKKGEFNFGK